ncbi:MAG: hypothetical protein A2W91_12490 [Bacteroidetes bacterium GWF2_38_335]|nr:MAG: hypothetical protein A2W91_12490 [Bacteroidetes bacterium GWF2_38_335]OFY76986.1 MAG: hypothetical protein A2281_00605 [Bacteroidetes bacterium RIFOXYA12_FULL_38_20]HBS86842.1 capsular biosynthesis protein [Bacteroidales bacterium]
MGFFDSLIRKNFEPLENLSGIVTDMHSHLIPGIDDGSKTIEESIDLVNKLIELGYKKIITTPHIMSDYYRNTEAGILAGLDTLRKALDEANIQIDISAAAEYYADFDFTQKIQKDKLLTFGNKYLLFEISYFSPPDSVEEIIFNIQTNGYKPVLAHPERYIYWHNKFEIYEKLKDRNVYFQLNINSLCGHYSLPVMKIAEKMIKNKMFEFVGSDTHNSNHILLIRESMKNPNLRKLVESGILINPDL